MITESQALGSSGTLFGGTCFGGPAGGEPDRGEPARGESDRGEEPGWDPCAGSLDAPACPSLGCWRAMLLESLASVDAKMDIGRPCLVARLDIGGNLMAHGRQAAQKSSDG